MLSPNTTPAAAIKGKSHPLDFFFSIMPETTGGTAETVVGPSEFRTCWKSPAQTGRLLR